MIIATHSSSGFSNSSHPHNKHYTFRPCSTEECLGSKNQHNNYHNDFLSKKNPKHTHEQKPSANFFELEHKIFDEF